jgi:hypothetical protein
MPRYNQYGYRFKRQQNKMLAGDNLALFLNSDPAVVERYRRQYRAAMDTAESAEAAGGATPLTEDVSLRGLGNAVLESKIYRVKSVARCKALRRRLQAQQAAVSSCSPTAIDCDSDQIINKADSTIINLQLASPFSGFDT